MLRLLVTRKWLIRHAMLLAAIAIFLALGWWQVLRAGEGNARSIGYAFEWPLLAGCAVYAWVRALRYDLRPLAERQQEQDASPRRSTSAEQIAAQIDEEPDDELAAYNRYLAWLHEQDQRQRR